VNDFDIQLIKKYLPKNKHSEALKKLESGYPVQYIIGNVEFYSLEIDVDENVLIPRFETEYLVDYTLKYLQKFNFVEPKILEIGTGSGCISLALYDKLNTSIDAIDISLNAINVAKKNALKYDFSINFINKSVETFLPNEKYDLIISNPPYVSLDEAVDEKTKYEPQNAIFADNNGLYFYYIILDRAKKWLKKGGLIAFEIGYKQKDPITCYAHKKFPLAKIDVLKDLNGFDRYIFIKDE